MADSPKNIAASVKQRLMNMARDQNRAFDILLVRFALERLLFRLSLSAYRDNYILKGGMLVTQWLEHNNRETRDMDFLGFGEADAEAIKAIFAEIMTIASDDGLAFDTEALTASAIREEMEYGGIRLRTTAYLERTRIPVTLDIGFGDALAGSSERIDYPSLLDMARPSIRAYPPVAVIAEKFQAVVALGLANGRMKDFYDLWAIPKAMPIDEAELDAAIAATFNRRATLVPSDRPVGLSETMAQDADAGRRWRAYIDSLALPTLDFAEVLDDIWALLAPSCSRLSDESGRA
jgi:predicted nucleotidyltransferase component of viral defense system